MRPSLNHFVVAVAGLAALAGVATVAGQAGDRPVYTGSSVKGLTAPLIDSSGNSVGAVQMWEDANGVVKIYVGASGLTPGVHGVHIHALGQCAGPAFTSAGGHYNVAGKKHGLESPDGHHNGDLPGLVADESGNAAYLTTTDDVSLLAGLTSIFDNDGSAFIIHAGPDDQVTDPTGNSGARVACALLADPAPGSIPSPTATTAAPAPPNTGTGAADGASSSPVVLRLAVVGLALAFAGGAIGLRRS